MRARTAFLALLALGSVLACDGADAAKQTEAAKLSASEAKDRWDNVAAVFTKNGMTVRTFDSEHPGWMTVVVPSSQATDGTTTPAQWRELAGTTHQHLGDDSIVHIESEGGQDLASASALGVQ